MLDLTLQIVAQAAKPSSGEMLMQMLVPFGLIFLVFYFLMMRPQAKQREKQAAFLNALKVGDEIVTAGGILGKITAIDETVVTIEISKGTKMKVLRSRVKSSKQSELNASKDSSE